MSLSLRKGKRVTVDCPGSQFDGMSGVVSKRVGVDTWSVLIDGYGDHMAFGAATLRRGGKPTPAPAPDVVAHPSGEVRSVSSSGAEKGTKPERYDLLPVEALAKVARHYGMGSTKYADHNWRKGYEWSKSYAALQRHANAFWGGEDIDKETGSPHMAGVAFHALTLLTYMDEQRQFDDRWGTREISKKEAA